MTDEQYLLSQGPQGVSTVGPGIKQQTIAPAAEAPPSKPVTPYVPVPQQAAQPAQSQQPQTTQAPVSLLQLTGRAGGGREMSDYRKQLRTGAQDARSTYEDLQVQLADSAKQQEQLGQKQAALHEQTSAAAADLTAEENQKRKESDEYYAQGLKEVSDLQKSVADTKIDDHRFWNNASVGGKIALALGAAAGAVSDGLNSMRRPGWRDSGPPAISGVLKLIDDDIASQVRDLDKKRDDSKAKLGIVGAIFQQKRDVAQSAGLAKVAMLEDAARKQEGLSDLAKNAQVKEGYARNAAALRLEQSKVAEEHAQKLAATAPKAANPLDVAKKLADIGKTNAETNKLNSEVGQGSAPIPGVRATGGGSATLDKTDRGKVQTLAGAYSAISPLLKENEEMIRTHGGENSLLGDQDAIAKVRSNNEAIAAQINTAYGNGAMSKDEHDKWMNSLVDLTDWNTTMRSDAASIAKVRGVRESFKTSVQGKLKPYGLELDEARDIATHDSDPDKK